MDLHKVTWSSITSKKEVEGSIKRRRGRKRKRKRAGGGEGEWEREGIKGTALFIINGLQACRVHIFCVPHFHFPRAHFCYLNYYDCQTKLLKGFLWGRQPGPLFKRNSPEARHNKTAWRLRLPGCISTKTPCLSGVFSLDRLCSKNVR